MSSFSFKKYPVRHRIITFVRDIDVKGFRKLSILLPKWLIPAAKESYILKTIHGFYLRINPAIDNGVELSLHQTGTYEKGILQYLKSTLKKGDCFVDVGANIGLMSIYSAFCVGETGTVLAFEAHPETAKLLQENCDLNNCSTISIQQFALGSTNGQTKIYDNWQVNRGGASLVIKTDSSASFDIEIRQLDAIFPADLIPRIIKIDVEGFELEVLKGAKNLLEKFQPILIIELSENRENLHESSKEILDFIREIGDYKFFKLKGGKERKSRLIEIKAIADLPAHDNIICVSNNEIRNI